MELKKFSVKGQETPLFDDIRLIEEADGHSARMTSLHTIEVFPSEQVATVYSTPLHKSKHMTTRTDYDLSGLEIGESKDVKKVSLPDLSIAAVKITRLE